MEPDSSVHNNQPIKRRQMNYWKNNQPLESTVIHLNLVNSLAFCFFNCKIHSSYPSLSLLSGLIPLCTINKCPMK
jgi:hypothetical protein